MVTSERKKRKSSSGTRSSSDKLLVSSDAWQSISEKIERAISDNRKDLGSSAGKWLEEFKDSLIQSYESNFIFVEDASMAAKKVKAAERRDKAIDELHALVSQLREISARISVYRTEIPAQMSGIYSGYMKAKDTCAETASPSSFKYDEVALELSAEMMSSMKAGVGHEIPSGMVALTEQMADQHLKLQKSIEGVEKALKMAPSRTESLLTSKAEDSNKRRKSTPLTKLSKHLAGDEL
mmetsp:Transcript_6097/g.10539  ORF Transcript_6097/g.10539 Transcript_6097/m.10539 type:complete len:238 (-) Transcript_6097:179-892(-)